MMLQSQINWTRETFLNNILSMDARGPSPEPRFLAISPHPFPAILHQRQD